MTETDIFKALADPTRRHMLERLSAGERNATELREGLAMSQPAISQHLAVLRSAGLIEEEKSGRQMRYRIRPDGLAPVVDWLARYRAFWPERVDRLKTLLREMDQ
ncbi:winged helix-turn-helix transcriptional regulator [Nitratireductor aquimarinus]|uniref:Metalloregulator ArsR/SmtB family transcription factor n=1 Tax=Nitratireductor aquimarinus TaxID=889300 RepID=A0ABU4ARD1_9HYPH|nr:MULTISPECIES: metalloregulator ArsR/SmtB family transcription factor [Alphaproteobacteria]MBY6020948.1 metalloregulator ArsR/SmtB family transcription factor [Nitratireductor sp. DP7N14-4]MBN7756162.1 winged helix-turn-helix transcriptional regulator [Nitratireductor aquimarinus]MBN7759649.1 winged helix-turn-helix transcriptional regulator [Nitratireductor aquibiodomus]MBN7778205.1 winged helix-turn-helix transcriptional regulator [Nitratireductor pacificus]MBN7782527.1 winged helix-turn-h